MDPEALEPEEAAVAGEEEQGQEAEQEEDVEEEVTPSRMGKSSGNDRGHLFYLLLEDNWVHLYLQGQGLLPLEEKAKPFPIPVQGARDLND